MVAPTVTSISPRTGDTVGGAVVYIMGANFNGTTGVTIGGVACPSFEAIAGTGDERLFAIAPAGAAGARDVVVTNADGPGTGVGLFTYTVPNATVYQLHLWDDCCHIFVSANSGNTFIEGCTPGSPSIPAPQDPGIDPLGVGTLLEEWNDGQMAINDGDYTSFVGFMENYRGDFGIIGVSLNHGYNQTYTLRDPYPGEPGFNDDGDHEYRHTRGAISSGAETILVCPSIVSLFPVADFWPRISRDTGATWNDVTGVVTRVTWAAAAFGSEGSQHMYLKPCPANIAKGINPAYLRKSTDWGVTWTTLTSGPDYQGVAINGAARCRLRCSADGQTVVMIARDTNFWISSDAGSNWTNIDFKTLTAGGVAGSQCDCAISPDGSTIVVLIEQVLTDGAGFPNFYPAVFVSTDGGANFTDRTSGLEYPNWQSPLPAPVTAPTYNARGASQCAVAPDGLGMIVTFGSDAIKGRVQPDGLNGFVLSVNVSYDAGVTWKLVCMDADPYELNSVLGFFTGVYITPPGAVPPPPVGSRRWFCEPGPIRSIV